MNRWSKLPPSSPVSRTLDQVRLNESTASRRGLMNLAGHLGFGLSSPSLPFFLAASFFFFSSSAFFFFSASALAFSALAASAALAFSASAAALAFSASAFLAAASAAFLASALAFSALAASAAALFSAALAACSAFALAAASALSSPALRAASSFRAAASAASAALAALIAATLEPASSEAIAVGLASAVWVVAPEEDLEASTLTTFTAVCAMTFLTAGSTPRATGADAGAWYAGGATFEPVFAFITEAGSKPRSSLYSAV
mmetsp:Transcript_13257/g.51899  ORF Transcript_13257/g.51899 Transcript_13257/m.51899 type:complete len:261 (-) Transcript_13257:286-1068(-)